MNRDIKIAKEYHEGTKHSYWSVRRGDHELDWATQPSTFKRHMGVPAFPLPLELDLPLSNTMNSIEGAGRPSDDEYRPLNLSRLAQVLYLSYGLTAKKVYPGASYYLRSAPSAGALYPNEVYPIVGEVEGLEAGVYHYSVGDFSLCRIRRGDLVERVMQACGPNPSQAPLVFALTSIFWRSSWKYRDRAYRYCLLDTGHLAGNFLALGGSLGLPVALINNFIDEEINKLIGVDGKEEATISLLSLGRRSSPPSVRDEPLVEPEVILKNRFQGKKEYPNIDIIHSASSYLSLEEISRGVGYRYRPLQLEGAHYEIAPDPSLVERSENLGETLITRRSSRDFHRGSITFEELSTILYFSTRPFPSDLGGGSLLDIFLVVNRVEGIPPGIYYFDRIRDAIVLMKEGGFSESAQYLSLEQPLAGNSAVTLFFTADLENILAAYGNRGYRHAHVEAGIVGQFLYLTTRALGIGASGIGAFYDDAVNQFLGLQGTGLTVIYDFAIGRERGDERLLPGTHL